MMSGHHGPYGLGNTRATMVVTTSLSEDASRSKSLKNHLSSDCLRKFGDMKSESLVIANQIVAVNTFSGLVHTARHTMGVGLT